MDSETSPVLQGFFEPAPGSNDQLNRIVNSPDEITRDIITERELRKAYYKFVFQRISYGHYQGRPACFLIIDGFLHTEDQRHRFKSVRIEVDFVNGDGAGIKPEIVGFAPEQAYGRSSPESHTSHWALRSRAAFTLPGTPVTVDLFDGRLGHIVEYQLDRVASMKGTTRGFPKQTRVVWTLSEAKQEGLPLRIPPLVILVTYAAGAAFKAKFSLSANVGFSMNPQLWPIVAKDDPVIFNESFPKGEQMDPDFSILDLRNFTKLDLID